MITVLDALRNTVLDYQTLCWIEHRAGLSNTVLDYQTLAG
jgi:hypothetical protein